MSTRVEWSDIVSAARQTSEELAGKDWVSATFKARTLLADLADVLERTEQERDDLLAACRDVLDLWRFFQEDDGSVNPLDYFTGHEFEEMADAIAKATEMRP
jgi:hypothetical protein